MIELVGLETLTEINRHPAESGLKEDKTEIALWSSYLIYTVWYAAFAVKIFEK